MFNPKNSSPADFIADALSGIITTAVKYFIVDKGIEYARGKVDDLLAPPSDDDVVEGEVVEDEAIEVKLTQKEEPKKEAKKPTKKAEPKK